MDNAMNEGASTCAWHCCEPDTLSAAMVNLETATATNTLSWGHNHKPMLHHWLWPCKWSWGHLWFDFWAHCRQQCDVLSGCRSAVSAQILQQHVSCSKCPTKSTEQCCMTVLQSDKYHGQFVYDLHAQPCAFLWCFPVLCLSKFVQNAHCHRQTFIYPWSACTTKKFCFHSQHYHHTLP